MDGSRFDELTRSLVTSRRGALRTLIAGVAAGLTHTTTAGAQPDDWEDRQAELEAERAAQQAEREAERAAREAEREAEQAAREAEREAEQVAREAEQEAEQAAREAFHRVGRSCANGQSCGTLAPCTNGVCTPIVCQIGGAIYQGGDFNPDNECQFCIPTLDAWTTWLGQVGDGAPCTQATDNPCLSIDGLCSGGMCVNNPFPDDSPCGADNVCCGGICCDPGECCSPGGVCGLCGDFCEISGAQYPAETINPNHDCQVCDPSRSADSWSAVDEPISCGTIAGRVCCNGDCCSPTECCNPTGFCEECGPHCRIGNEDVDEGARNPQNDCEACNPQANLTGWTQLDDDTECGDFLQVCCNGVCCEAELCCSDDRACDVCGCEIGGESYEDGEFNPDNDCEFCNRFSPSDWTSLSPNSPCGPGGNRNCCEGACCPSGQCCTPDGCGECPCEIGNREYADGQPNESNSCQVCNVDENRFDWTIIDDGEPCVGSENQECCGGQCCPPGQCCASGQCQDCGCVIGGTPHEAGAPHPTNPCLECGPESNLADWSPVDGDATCGPSGNQTCCEGECCDEGECCLLGACGTCLCSILNVTYADDSPNPSNSCEYCNQEQDPFDWTVRTDDTPCGEDGVCCSGNCCDSGLCCLLGVCQFCGCRIGDETWDEFQINPANECEICDPVRDPFSWSPRSDEPCGSEQICCGGTCCASGECCGLLDTCEECRCQIDGDFYSDDELNSENACLVCDVQRSRTAWSISSNETCGENGDQVCCNGACCEAAQCCNPESLLCESCDCTIEGTGYASGNLNSNNKCETCDPERSEDSWSVVLLGPCGDNNELKCCDGVCCEAGECCSANLTCEECGCTVNGEGWATGNFNPDNVCQYCDPETSTESWSPYPDGRCGEGGSQVCCDGTCCPEGECCDPDLLTCGECDCTIEGDGYNTDDLNPVNNCQICDPERSSSSWSGESDTPCGVNGEQYCCDGECCPENQCCDPDTRTCGDCDCTIDSRGYPRSMLNPTNKCETCDPQRSTESWSIVLLGPCGENDELECCDGVCCPTGQCCSLSLVCVDCCSIDSEGYPGGSKNPENECEVCTIETSRDSWTLADDNSACGAAGDMVCCSGTCTSCECVVDDGARVGAAGTIVCHQPCTIEGVDYAHGEPNPENPCEVCDSEVSTESWSEAPFLTKCGNGDQICCHGVCCPNGDCCNPQFSFCSIEWCGTVDPCPYIEEPCGCTIDGQFYENRTINPNNECEWCDPYWSTTSWSSRPPYIRCGPFGDRLCCDGICCETGSCCRFGSDICEAGAPGCVGCTIGGRYFGDGFRNPDDPCQQCNVAESTTSWSMSPPGRVCEAVIDDDGVYWGDRVCCQGVCCELYACCNFSNMCELPHVNCQ